MRGLATGGYIVLEDGTVFRGESVGADGTAYGEAVFATAMTGYQEILTDPSYSEQLICFTAPMVGNYGVAAGRSESSKPHARAVIMREARGPAWTSWLSDHGIVALTGIDTRSLVLHLRDSGAMRAAAVAGDGSPEETLETVREQPAMSGRALAAEVSTTEPFVYADAGLVSVAVIDYGTKRSILRRLASAGARVTVVPHDADTDTLSTFDGVLLSNGPGDPEPLENEVATIRALLGRTSVFGICLGHQLLGPATRPTSCPSATAAPTTPYCTGRAGACWSPVRTTASRSPRRTRKRRPTSRSTTARSRGSPIPTSTRTRCSSIPKPARARTTPGR